MYPVEKVLSIARTGLHSSRLSKNELRALVFEVNQLAQASLQMEKTNLRLSAVTMALLDTQIRRVASLHDAFSEWADKDYAANVVQLVEHNAARMKALLSSSEQSTLERSIAVVERLPDYTYFVNNYAKVERYRQLLPEYQRRAAATDNQNKSLAAGGLVLGGSLLLFGPLLCLGVVGLGGILLSEHGAIGALFIVLAFVGFIASVWLWTRQRAKARDIENQVRAITAEVDLVRFAELEREFGSDLERIKQRLQTAETELATIYPTA